MQDYKNNPGVPDGSQEDIWNRLCYIIHEAAPQCPRDVPSSSSVFWIEFFDLFNRLNINLSKQQDDLLGEMMHECQWNDLMNTLDRLRKASH